MAAGATASILVVRWQKCRHHVIEVRFDRVILVSWNTGMEGDAFRPERIRSTGVPLGPAACANSRRAFDFAVATRRPRE